MKQNNQNTFKITFVLYTILLTLLILFGPFYLGYFLPKFFFSKKGDTKIETTINTEFDKLDKDIEGFQKKTEKLNGTVNEFKIETAKSFEKLNKSLEEMNDSIKK